MNLYLLFFFWFILLVDGNENFSESLNNIVGKAMDSIGFQEINEIIKILKEIAPQTNEVIGPRYDEHGFSRINSINDHSYGTILADKIELLIQLWFEDESFNFLSISYKKIIFITLRELALQIFEDNYHKQKNEFSFNDGKGKLFILSITFSLHHKIQNAIKWEKSLFWTEFEPAPSYVILTKSKCKYFSCHRKDEIKYLPVVLTNAHVESIININLKMSTQFNIKILELA